MNEELMQEAARLLKDAHTELLNLCMTCLHSTEAAGFSVDCKTCKTPSLDGQIVEFLAKLEGGAEDERD